MRLTRHAKNRARRYGISRADIAAVILNPIHHDRDEKGQGRYVGEVRGIRIRVVVAVDEPNVVITVHPRRGQ
jgi:Domain of unknown function (DUF4258)